MPSEEFYTLLGAIGGGIAIVGGFMAFSDPSITPPIINFAGGIILLAGIIMLLIMVGGAGVDIYKRVRGWRLEEREGDLGYKEKEIAVKQKEAELKRQERKVKEEQKRRAQQEEFRRRKESPKQEKSYQKERQQTSSTYTPQEESRGFESEKQEFKDDAWFGTGSKVPDELKEKTEQTETQSSKAEKNELEKEAQSEKDYKYEISLDKALLLLWTLYKNEKHEFPTRNKLVLAANKGKEGGRESWYPFIDELLNNDLVHKINVKKFADKKPDEWGVKLTEVGSLLIKKARYDQVTKFDDFQKKYSRYLRR